MKKQLYQLANKLDIREPYKPEDEGTRGDGYDGEQYGELEYDEKEKYEYNILDVIGKEKKSLRRKRLTASAACLALVCVLVMNSHVQTIVAKSLGSIRSFLGIQNDLTQYTEIVDASVSNNGYLATLKEVIVAEDKIAVSYTLQRENGKPFPCARPLTAALYVDGKEIYSGMGAMDFLDHEHKIQGNEMTYIVPGIDLAEEKSYELKIADYSGGKWEFQFKASGAELAADTKRMELGKEIALPNGEPLILSDLTVNHFEQRINYDKKISDKYYEIKIEITDQQGMRTSFYEEWLGKSKSYLLNDNWTDSFLMNSGTETAAVQVWAAEWDETYSQTSDWEQIGEFILDLSSLK